jgi:NitT/TauT family transport system substrate-binding protein
MNSDFIEKRHDVAVKVVRAYWDAYQYWRKNPAEAAQIMADGLKFSVEDVEKVIGPGADREKSLLFMYDFTESAQFCGVAPGDPPFGQTNGQLYDVMKQVNDWWLKFGYMKETIPPEKYVDCGLMRELHEAGYAGTP